MLECLHHTWLGGFVVHLILAGSWTLGPAFVALVAAGMARGTWGLSYMCFGVLLIDSMTKRKALMVACLLTEAYCGPRSMVNDAFLTYWCCFCAMALILFWTYFASPLKIRPGFMKAMQDLDFSQYYAGVELRGAVDDIQSSGSIFGFHPHGVLSVGFSLNGVWSKKFLEASGPETQFLVDRGLREDNVFFKTICDLKGGIRTLSKKVLHSVLKSKQNMAFVPGGFQDATLYTYGAHRTSMKKRTGFIKYALQYGCRVHCLWTFGEEHTHYTLNVFEDFRLWLNQFGIPAVMMFGFPPLPLFPRPQARLLTYVSKGIQFPEVAAPTDEDVRKWHKIYIKTLVELFEEHKKEVGLPESATLEIC